VPADATTLAVAYIAGGISLLSVLISSLVAFHMRRVDERIQKSVNAAKGELKHDLKTHEVRLRIDAEFRLRILERMLTDVADFRSKLGDAIAAVTLLTHEVEPNGGNDERARELLWEALKAFGALSGAGPVMPPDLRAKASELANRFQDALRDVVNWSSLPSREERRQRCIQTDERMAEMGRESHALFGGWLAARFDATLRAIEKESAAAAPAELPPGPAT
jgi:hypothetical protein